MIFDRPKNGDLKTRYSFCFFPESVWFPKNHYIPPTLRQCAAWDSADRKKYWFEPVKITDIYLDEIEAFLTIKIDPVSFYEAVEGVKKNTL